MLHRSPQVSRWKQILRRNMTQWEKLADFLELDQEQQKKILTYSKFPLNLPVRLAEKIVKGTLGDPILKQFLPTKDENQVQADYVLDPVGDTACRSEPKLLHKYEGRVLLVCTSACAMHCRYCFRQNFDYEVKDNSFAKELARITSDGSIHEVILSGGDPLSLSERVLKKLLEELSIIPHVKRIRFHTRFPIGIPERIDDEFVAMIESLRQQVWFVFHINHVNELDDDIIIAFRKLQKIGCVLLNQAVLLKGVNDDVETLATLCETLVNVGVLPYYLHQLDRVQGAGHFEVREEQGKYLVEELTKRLPGYAVPKYVREIAGMPSKTLL
jgi:EF-P beta-lysylation protein EpmB